MRLLILLGAILLPFFSVASEIKKTGKSSLILGGGAGFASLPHYPGADENEKYFLPIPYVDFVADRFSINDEGLNAKVLNSNLFSLEFDVTGSLPVSSDDNKSRSGMPDLGFFLEVGPEISMQLIDNSNHSFSLDLPIRLSFELLGQNKNLNNKFIQNAGYLLEPSFHYAFKKGLFEIELDAGFIWASHKYQHKFFSVQESYSSSSRPEFTARAGKMGNRLSTTLKYETDDWLIINYLKFIDLSQGINRNSPLIKDNSYILGGIGLIRKFKIW